MSQNSAAWLMDAHTPFTVKEAPYPTPQPNEVIIQVQAVATNPLDYKIIGLGVLKYPTILGSDAAGTVVEVGSEVKNFSVKDRVFAHCTGFFRGNTRGSAYQKYVAVSDRQPVRIPEHISFAEAAVLPVSCDTAMAGLYVEEFLGLQYPGAGVKSTGKTLLGTQSHVARTSW
jgi:NADPH:quinone reductase-like Zn-dependent oxidoreductase